MVNDKESLTAFQSPEDMLRSKILWCEEQVDSARHTWKLHMLAASRSQERGKAYIVEIAQFKDALEKLVGEDGDGWDQGNRDDADEPEVGSWHTSRDRQDGWQKPSNISNIA